MRNKKILLVDDEVNILNSLRKDFVHEGYTVATATDGEEAISNLRNDHFDLMVTDIVMPGVDGIAVLQAAKKQDPEIVAIILTGCGGMSSAIEALRLGADDYLLKPYDVDELLLRTRHCLKKQEALRKVKLYEKRLKAITDQSGDGITVADPEGNYTFVNPAFCNMMGYSEEELLQMTIFDVKAKSQEKFSFAGSQAHEKDLAIEVLLERKDGTEFIAEVVGNMIEIIGQKTVLRIIRDITERKQAEEAHMLHLRFLENIERVNHAIQQASDVEQMMSYVLQITLEIFQCDRVWLLYPCDPEAESWSVPMERTRPEYPGAFALGEEIPMLPEIAEVFREALKVDDVLTINHQGQEGAYETARRFSTLSEMYMLIHPKSGKPWVFGLHQCSYYRDWTDEESYLFREIGRRLGDGLNSMLALRDLRASEEKWRSLTMYSPDYVMLLDCDGTIRFINYTVPDFSVEQVLGTSVLDYVSQDFHQKMVACFKQVAKFQQPDTYETNYHTKEGEVRHFETRVAPVLDQRKTVALILTARDITGRKQAEYALREGEERFRALIESVPDGIIISDQSGNITLWNRGAQIIFEYRVDEITGKPVEVLMPETYRRRHREGMQGLLKTGRGKHIGKMLELEGLRKDGRVFPLELSLSTWQTRDMRFFAAIIRDITGRKRSEDALRASEERYRMLFERSSDAIFMIELDTGRYLDANAAAERLTGRSGSELKNLTTQDLPPYCGRERLQQVAAAKEAMDMDEVVYIRPDGSTRIALLSVVPLNEQIIFGLARDITERKLAQETLIQNEKMLSVGGLAAGMAHEINNPLGGMMQTAQVLSNRLTDSDLPANQRAAEAAGTSMEAIRGFMEARGIIRMLGRIRESGRRAARVVQNMLSFAHKSSDATSLHNLAELLNQTVDLAGSDYDLKKKFDFRQIKIFREYEPDLPAVPCDASKIQQVLLNILRNGAQAMQEENEELRPVLSDVEGLKNEELKKPCFVVRLTHEKTRGMVQIEIVDNGPGMDEATRKRVFEPFFTTKPVGLGTGLGLSVSYFIITENHGGEMSVESIPGEGTTFIIRLPLERSHPVP